MNGNRQNTPIPVRYSLDFRIIPHWFYSDPAAFLYTMESKREELFEKVFNDYYKPANESFLSNDPKSFTKEDFRVQCYALTNNQVIYCVELPDEHDNSMVWCKAYLFAYDIAADRSTARVRFYTIEESNAGTKALCSIERNGSRSNYGSDATDDMEKAASKVAVMMFLRSE